MVCYLVIFSSYGLVLCLYDKIMAILGKRRISEKRLFGVALVGGCFGILVGMILGHHKIRKIRFLVGIPLCCLMWLIIFLMFRE